MFWSSENDSCFFRIKFKVPKDTKDQFVVSCLFCYDLVFDAFCCCSYVQDFGASGKDWWQGILDPNGKTELEEQHVFKFLWSGGQLTRGHDTTASSSPGGQSPRVRGDGYESEILASNHRKTIQLSNQRRGLQKQQIVIMYFVYACIIKTHLLLAYSTKTVEWTQQLSSWLTAKGNGDLGEVSLSKLKQSVEINTTVFEWSLNVLCILWNTDA